MIGIGSCRPRYLALFWHAVTYNIVKLCFKKWANGNKFETLFTYLIEISNMCSISPSNVPMHKTPKNCKLPTNSPPSLVLRRAPMLQQPFGSEKTQGKLGAALDCSVGRCSGYSSQETVRGDVTANAPRYPIPWKVVGAFVVLKKGGIGRVVDPSIIILPFTTS